MNKHKTTLLGVIVYTIKNNYLIFTYLFIPLLMNDYKNSAYLAPVIFIPIAFFLILLLPKKIYEIDYNGILNRTVIPKISYQLVQIISLLINVIISGYTIQRMFYYNYGILLFIIPTVLIVLIISTCKVEVIFNSSVLLFLIAILLIIGPVFLANEVKDFTLVKPLYKSDSLSLLLIFYFILDSISIIFSGANIKGKLTKWKLSIPIFIILVFMSLELLNIIIITGDTYLLDNEFLGFFTLFIQDTINYIGNLGLFFLFVIPVVGCYKAGYSLRKLKESLKIKDNLLVNIILFLAILFISYMVIFFIPISKFIYYSILVSIILLAVLYVFILLNRSRNYEIRF